MKVAVIGSRTFKDTQLLESILTEYKTKITCIISGGANGADQLAEAWANNNDIVTMIFKPDWKMHGRAAGVIRNQDIIQNCDICIAFWDGTSKGTSNSISLCKKYNKPVTIINFK